MAAVAIGTNFGDIESDGSKAEDGLLSSECDTPMYEKPQFSHYFRQDSADKHVQFNVGECIKISVGNRKVRIIYTRMDLFEGFNQSHTRVCLRKNSKIYLYSDNIYLFVF